MPFVTVHGRKLDTMLIPGSSPGSIPGASDAPCLVFLHEGLGSIGLWRRFPGQVAAATGCPALVWSRQGYGRSDPPAASRGLDYLHIEALEMLPGLLDALDIHDPILIGHSDGASIALLHAGLANRPVRGIVLEAPHVFVEDITLDGIRAAGQAWRDTDLPARLGRHHDDAERVFASWRDTWLSPEFRDWNIEDCLPSITCPVLLIQGRDDEYGTPDQIGAIARQVAGPAETLLLDRCGHTPHRDQPDAVLAAIAGFVARCRSQSSEESDTMTIKRIEPGPRMSQAVVHNGIAYLAGQVADDPNADVTDQTRQVLGRIDTLLEQAGTGRDRLLTATVYLADIADFAAMNAAWEPWVDPANPPARATVEAKLAAPQYRVEIVVTAAV